MGYYKEFKKYVTWANVRLDLKKQEGIFWHQNLTYMDASVRQHSPNPSLGFGDSGVGSDIGNVLRTFLSHRPICGSVILLALKRNTNEQDLSDIIQQLRQHHVYVYTMMSNQPSGGLYSDPIYQLSSESSGMMIFNEDHKFSTNAIISYLLRYNPYYNVNLSVFGKGSRDLPVLSVKDCDAKHPVQLNLGITVQNHASLDDFKSMKITFNSPRDYRQENVMIQQGQGTVWWISMGFYVTTDYKVTLDYDYDKEGEVEIRMSIDRNVTNWPAFNDF